jgi:hypothetical protein
VQIIGSLSRGDHKHGAGPAFHRGRFFGQRNRLA